jgi:transcriptional regulator with XRE-family HTH domain
MPKKRKAQGTLLPHPLAQLRATLGWTREQCAKETGIPAPTIQNIERATTPLTWDQARIIDAVTGCHALDLGYKSDLWRAAFRHDLAGLQKAATDPALAAPYAPTDLEGRAYARKFYDTYCQLPLPAESREKALKDLTMRLQLLLGPLAKEPRKFRRAYRHLAQVLDDEKAAAELDDLKIAEYATRFGKAIQGTLTVAELDATRGLKDDAEWHEIKKAKTLKPDDVIQITVEDQPHWPKRDLMSSINQKAIFIGDFAAGRRRVWRMVLPDGTPFAVAYIETYSEGLKQTFPPDLLPDTRPAQK